MELEFNCWRYGSAAGVVAHFADVIDTRAMSAAGAIADGATVSRACVVETPFAVARVIADFAGVAGAGRAAKARKLTDGTTVVEAAE